MLRGRKLRAHMKACAGCREFKETIDLRRQDLAAMAPALPALAAATLLQGVVGSGHGGGGMLAGLASGAAGKVAATSTVAKGVATIAVVATVGAGAAGVTGNLPAPLERKAPTGQARDSGAAAPPPVRPLRLGGTRRGPAQRAPARAGAPRRAHGTPKAEGRRFGLAACGAHVPPGRIPAAHARRARTRRLARRPWADVRPP